MTQTPARKPSHTDSAQSSTFWNQFTLDDIWDMVATEDGRVTYIQVDAWRRLSVVCQDQADQLERALTQLTQRWPNTPGSASDAFANQLLTLINSMRQAAQAGTANQAPLTRISTVLTDARIEIAALMQARREYARAEAELSIPRPLPTPGQAVPSQPVAPPQDWRAQLDNQARSIMARSDTIVGIEAEHIEVPQPFRLRTQIDRAAASVARRPPIFALPNWAAQSVRRLGAAPFRWLVERYRDSATLGHRHPAPRL